MQRLLQHCLHLRLRYLFLATFALVAVLPAAALTGWVANQALSQEKASAGVKERHLAEVVAFGLDRYANDVRAVFEHMASLEDAGHEQRAVFRLARSLGFRYIALIGEDKKIREFTDYAHDGGDPLQPDLVDRIVAQATRSPAFLPLMRDGLGKPTLFVVEGYQDGTVLAAALSTRHIKATQEAVSFGSEGRAVIVDRLGQVIAHPKAEWEAEIKSLASVAPVQALLRSPAGHMEFDSPSGSEPMMAGYARAEGSGWGVLTVRPISEIETIAWDYAKGSIAFVAIGLLAALVLAAVMARVIVRPVERVAAVAQRLSHGDMTAKVDPVPQVPAELGELARTINSLSASLNLWRLNLTESLQEAEASSREKSHFLASLSHEIRSPLNVVVGFAEALRDGQLGKGNPAKTAEYATDIAAAGRHLVRLIDGILALSQIDNGQLAMATGPVALEDAVSAVVQVMEPLAGREDIRLDCDLPRDLPDLLVNESKLKQVLLNLISNAVKFTPQGGSVTVSAEALENGMVSLRIADTGIGMSSRDLETALKPFGRVEKAWTRGRTGTGLGLPLARQLVEEMAGSFAIDSLPGRGTTVTLTLPATALSKAA
ncbi:MAG: HAMP domain-containing protein [Alphaproteobacteria bacterium]|nr:HAMP domain-containing protein [Alphaproteobacteria bacterium]MCB9927970.1 HAMP domain-containing protein [Alphaproteobacteria bacterium]